MEARNKPIIMTAEMGSQDFAWLNTERLQYYPPERNFVPAHITLFHHLPPRALDEIKRAILNLTGITSPPRANIDRLIHMDGGVAYHLHAPELLDIRMYFSDLLHGLLAVQDQQTPRLHITIQNKVSRADSKALYQRISTDFEPRPLQIRGLSLHYYVDGPWENIGSWQFRGR